MRSGHDRGARPETGCEGASGLGARTPVVTTPHPLVPSRFSARARKTAPEGGCAPHPVSATGPGGGFIARLLLVLFIVLGGGVEAGRCAPAKVSLRDGTVREGEVLLHATGALELRPAGAAATTIPFAQLDRVIFGAAARRPAPSVELRAGQGMAPWQLANVGASVTPAMLGEAPGAWTLGTAPGDARHGYDDFHFLHHPLVGDGELVVHLLRYSDKVDYSRSGIGFFESLADRSRHVRLIVSQRKGGGLSIASKAGKTARTRHTVKTLVPPLWLKLERRGDEFIASRSADGRAWEIVETATVELPKNLQAGLLATITKSSPEYAARFDHLRLAQRTAVEGVYPQITLSSGSVLAGAIASLDGTRLTLRIAGAPRSFSVLNVGTIAFDWLRPDLAARLRPGRPGVLLTTGDFVDGEVHSLTAGRVAVNSVLFGRRDYVFPGEALAVTLGKSTAPPPSAEFTVRLRDGSRLLARSLGAREQRLLIEEPTAGIFTVALDEVAEIYRTVLGEKLHAQ